MANALEKPKKIYFVGIKGVGMTALAQILQWRGKLISGSDTQEKFFTDKVLKKLKIPFREGFKASNLSAKTELVIYSTAFNPKNHPELIAAKKKNIPILSYPQAVSLLFNNSLGIAIAGSHGKTTTSALVAESLKNLKLDPTALIGSRVTSWKTNALAGKSPFFVIEADEHQNKLKFYNPWSLILNNIDYDHPDFFKKESDYYQAFKNWIQKWAKRKAVLPKIGIFNGDDSKVKRILRELKLKSSKDLIILTFGSKNGNNIIVNELKDNKLLLEFNIPGVISHKAVINTSLVGQHNAFNLGAAFGFTSALLLLIREISQQEDIDNSKPSKINDLFAYAAKSFGNFEGTERRTQLKGKRGNVMVFDDYAHHPEEIRVTLTALKKSFSNHQLFVIFQPHTYTRTRTFLKEFASALQVADKIALLEIYGSARENEGEISSKDLRDAVNRKSSKSCKYFATHNDCLDYLKVLKFDGPTILITMGAGDGWQVGEKFLKFKN